MWDEKAFTLIGVGNYGPHIREPPEDWGSGRSLPPALLLLCTLATLFTTVVSSYSVWLQLKHYFKPRLQRYVVRILIMLVLVILPLSGPCYMRCLPRYPYFHCNWQRWLTWCEICTRCVMNAMLWPIGICYLLFFQLVSGIFVGRKCNLEHAKGKTSDAPYLPY